MPGGEYGAKGTDRAEGSEAGGIPGGAAGPVGIPTSEDALDVILAEEIAKEIVRCPLPVARPTATRRVRPQPSLRRCQCVCVCVCGSGGGRGGEGGEWRHVYVCAWCVCMRALRVRGCMHGRMYAPCLCLPASLHMACVFSFWTDSVCTNRLYLCAWMGTTQIAWCGYQSTGWIAPCELVRRGPLPSRCLSRPTLPTLHYLLRPCTPAPVARRARLECRARRVPDRLDGLAGSGPLRLALFGWPSPPGPSLRTRPPLALAPWPSPVGPLWPALFACPPTLHARPPLAWPSSAGPLSVPAHLWPALFGWPYGSYLIIVFPLGRIGQNLVRLRDPLEPVHVHVRWRARA